MSLITTENGVIKALEKMLEYARVQRLRVIVVGHHPIKSNGKKTGRIFFSDLRPSHLFRQLRRQAKIALGISPVMKIKNRINRVFVDAIKKGLTPVIYASGDEHNLEIINSVHKKGSIFYLISGLGSRHGEPVGSDASMLFAYYKDYGGFLILDFFEKGKIRLSALAPNINGKECNVDKVTCELFSIWVHR